METSGQTLSTNLSFIVRACRLGDYGEAASTLNKCIPCFESLQQEALREDGGKPLLDKINKSLGTILLMMERKDWVALADIVEFELLPLYQSIPRAES